ncbi:sigma-70 family RNA polymerase sigma factor [uncultured Paracoccus sp.]|uniref:RNA polymerase sigma factor n=1 Tax=uncultured Paracoccus sp. TaxID=189685 RepID=UPI002618FBCC|nr:sigma-70 family RNA polymerase sigma factor [uncultured Paracoccus sp.]
MPVDLHPQPDAAAAHDRDPAIDRQLIESRQAFLRFFRRRLARPEDAEDALQDFVLKVIRAAETLQDGEKIDAWIGRILRNTLTDHYRRRATRQNAEAAFAREPLQQMAHEPPPQIGTCGCIHNGLAALKPEYADVIRRADLQEMPRDCLAAELGLTPNNLGVRLHRARQALRARLEKSCSGCRDGGFLSCECDSAAVASTTVPNRLGSDQMEPPTM